MSDLVAEAFVATPAAAKYAAQMCKHFKHKVNAEFADGVGDIDFKFAKATLSARPDGLSMRCWAGDPAGLGRGKYVLEDHLKRFAFRENFGAIVWTGPEAPPPSP